MASSVLTAIEAVSSIACKSWVNSKKSIFLSCLLILLFCSEAHVMSCAAVLESVKLYCNSVLMIVLHSDLNQY